MLLMTRIQDGRSTTEAQSVIRLRIFVLVSAIFLILSPAANVYGTHSDWNAGHRLISTWAKSYGGIANDGSFAIQATKDGGYAVTGMTVSFGAGLGDLWVLRLNQDGKILWQRTYGPGVGESIKETSNGGFIVVGLRYAPCCPMWILKLDTFGNVGWQRGLQLGGGVAYDVEETIEGDFVVAGDCVTDPLQSTNACVVRLDSIGNVTWQRAYGGGGITGLTQAFSMDQTLDNGYVIAGETVLVPTQQRNMWVSKLAANSTIEWQYAYGGLGISFADSIKHTLDGGYIVGGRSPSGDAWILKLNSIGAIVWQTSFKAGGLDTALHVEPTRDGGYVVGGDISLGAAAMLLKLNSTGGLIWQRIFGMSTAIGASIYSVHETRDGGYVAAGWLYPASKGKGDVWVLKLDSVGRCCPGIILNLTGTVTKSQATVSATSVTAQTTHASVMTLTTSYSTTNATVTIQCAVQHQISNPDHGDDSVNGDSNNHERKSESKGEDSHYLREIISSAIDSWIRLLELN